jgi:hypothetical protein
MRQVCHADRTGASSRLPSFTAAADLGRMSKTKTADHADWDRIVAGLGGFAPVVMVLP